MRLRIYHHLLLLPGDHLRSIIRSLTLGTGVTLHHLDILLRWGYVRRERDGLLVRFYPIGEGSEEERNQLYRQHWRYRNIRERIQLTLRRIDKARPVEVAKSLRISRQLAIYHLSELERLGLVRREGSAYRAEADPVRVATAGRAAATDAKTSVGVGSWGAGRGLTDATHR